MKTEIRSFLSLTVVAMILLLSCMESVFAITEPIKLSKETTVIVASNSYARSSGVKQEGSNLSFQTYEWVEYEVEAQKEGEYDIVMTVGSPSGKVLEITVNGENPFETGFGSTGGLTVSTNVIVARVTFKAGLNSIRIRNILGSYYFSRIGFAPVVKPQDGVGAYKEAELPATIEAEDFDWGPDGYNSIDGINNGYYYRSEGIDIFENTDKNGYYVKITPNEFVKYTFNVKEDSAYTLYASGYGQIVDVYFDECETPLVSEIQKTKDNPETEIVSIFLEKGQHSVKFAASRGGLELDYLRFVNATGDYITIDDIPKFAEDEEKTDEEETINPVYKNLYVAENGSDDNSGTKESPFKTLKRAKEETSKISENMTGDIIVNIAPGYYQLEETEIFNESHSGKNGFNIIYKGESELSAPVISGGKKVSGWEQISDKMWRAPISTQSNVRNLYINGLPAIRARSKYLYTYLEDYNEDGFKVSVTNFPTEVVSEKALELVWNKEWTTQRTLVDSLAIDGNKVVFSMQKPYWEQRNNTMEIGAGSKFYIENAFCLLDEPGEFFYDKEEKYIYYYPYAEENLLAADVYISELEGLIKLEGSSLENKIANITFDNLDFRYGAWEEVSESGFICVQADYLENIEGKSRMIPGQIALNRAKNVNFKNSRFSCLGSTAITMVDAVSDSFICGNLFKDISGSAVLIGTPEHKEVSYGMEMCRNIKIENNVFRRVACEYHSSVGVLVFYERNIDIVHNTFLDSTYSQISVGWGWGSDSKTCGEITIEYNRFEDAMHTLMDGAHLYTLGANPGSSIRKNYFLKSNNGAKWGGVYTDTGSAYFKIEGNVFEETPNLWHVGQFFTHDMSADNNYIDCEQNFVLRSNTNTATNTIVVTDGNWPDEAKQIMNEAGVETEYKNLLNISELPEWKRSATKTIPKEVVKTDFHVVTNSEATTIASGEFTQKGENGERTSPSAGFATGDWVEYEVDVLVAGYYDIYMTYKTDQAIYSAKEKVKINGGTEKEITVDPTKTFTEYATVTVSRVKFNEGKNTIKLTATSGTIYIKSFGIEFAHGVNISEMAEIPADEFTDGYNGDFYKPTTGLGTNHWNEYTVSALEEGYYRLYMTYRTKSATGGGKIGVSANGGSEMEISLNPTPAFEYTSEPVYLGAVKLNKGSNIIKIRGFSGTIYIGKYHLEFKNIIKETSISIPAKEYIGDSSVSAVEDDHIVMEGGCYTSYNLMVKDAGYYNINMTYATEENTNSVKEWVSINGETEKEVTLVATQSPTKKVTVSISRVKLNEGKNTIKVRNASGTIYIEKFDIRFAHIVKATEMMEIPSNEFMQGDNGVLLKPSSGFQYNHWNEYVVNVETAGYYRLYTTYRTDNAKYGGKIAACANGGSENEISLVPTLTYTYTSEPVYLMDVMLNKGLNTIKIRGLAGTVYIGKYHLEFKNIIKESSISIPAKEYTGDYNVLGIEGGHVIMGYNCYTSYDVIVKNAGFYNIYQSCRIGQENFGFKVGLNGEAIAEKVLPSTGGLGIMKETLVAGVYMDEGLNTINIASISAGSCYFDAIRISALEPEITAVKLGDSSQIISGTHDIVVDVTNPSGISGKLICALYNGNQLAKVFISTNTVPNGAVLIAENCVVDTNISRVKVMFLKDTDTSFVPHCKAMEITK